MTISFVVVGNDRANAENRFITKLGTPIIGNGPPKTRYFEVILTHAAPILPTDGKYDVKFGDQVQTTTDGTTVLGRGIQLQLLFKDQTGHTTHKAEVPTDLIDHVQLLFEEGRIISFELDIDETTIPVNDWFAGLKIDDMTGTLQAVVYDSVRDVRIGQRGFEFAARNQRLATF